ncbi:hypothetical protein OIO90_002675 [Microbotryomycetes sp. JL221]|nr:hypothetical protein OIO90_002675 [Microbotryomycetes sp. JL221]
MDRSSEQEAAAFEIGDATDYDPAIFRLHVINGGRTLPANARPSNALQHRVQHGKSDTVNRRSSSPNLLGKLLGNTAQLQVGLRESQLFLHPVANASQDTPTNDPLLHGTVTLILAKRQTVHRLTVKVIGKQTLYLPGHSKEETIVLERKVSLHDDDNSGLDLDKGAHKFAFTILIPSSTPPYERCQFGKVRHYVVAKASGLGKVGSLHSDPVDLFLVPDPGGPSSSGPAPPLNVRAEGMLDNVAAFAFEALSSFLMISGLVLIRFNLLPLAQDITIESLTVSVRQSFALTSPSNLDDVIHPPHDKLLIAYLDGDNVPNDGKLECDQPNRPQTGALVRPLWSTVEQQRDNAGTTQLEIRHLCRLPKDPVLRPSYVAGSQSYVRTHHQLELEVAFRTGNVGSSSEQASAQTRVVTISRDISIVSCGAHLSSLALPGYSVEDPSGRDTDAVNQYYICLCGLKIDKLVERHGTSLLKKSPCAPPPPPKTD